MEDTVVPVLIVLIVFGGPITAFIVWRVLAYRERIEMIRHGFVPPPPAAPDPRMVRNAMKGQEAWPPPGAPMPPGQYSSYYDPSYYADRQLRRGIQVAFIGLALLIGLSFIHPGGSYLGPWLLGGLIPLFVGIAQVITAILGGAQFSPGGHAGATFGPPHDTVSSSNVPPAGASAPPPPPSAGSYGAWRPGNTPGIEKPAGPPDRL